MKKTVKEIAKFINGEVVGQEALEITGLNSIENAKEGDLTFADNPKHAQFIEKTAASCVVTSKDIKESSKTIIRTENPAMAFGKLMTFINSQAVKHPAGVHATAVIEKSVKLGKNVSVGAYSVIEEGVEIGDDCIIYAGCYIGRGTKIGKSVIIYPRVVIRDRILIGSRVIVHSGTVIGTDGFGYHQHEGKHIKIPQIGRVVIGDDVEIGSCATIDRATLGETIIGNGTKIDNLVQVAHNVKIGENCILVSQTGISGSTTLGRNVMLAGQVGLVDHISLGDKMMVAAQSGVTKSFPAGTIVFGSPARPIKETRKMIAASGRLPRLLKRVAELEKKLAALLGKK